MMSLTEVTSGDAAAKAQRRRDMFGDCALVEIIHLHDCLRGAIRALQRDVTELSKTVISGSGGDSRVGDLERRVAGRFQVIWSVFRAHSAAEDEFIWPALQSKTGQHQQQQQPPPSDAESSDSNDVPVAIGRVRHDNDVNRGNNGPVVIEQEEYEEDHADEERMFRTMDELLSKLRRRISNQHKLTVANEESVAQVAAAIVDLTSDLSKHLLNHLEKEETQCMPLVAKHFSSSEINELVGQIMGKRSCDTISNILTMAVQNLDEAERDEMVRYMKQAMVGTFFERWLSMGGWTQASETITSADEDDEKKPAAAEDSTYKEKEEEEENVRTERMSEELPASVEKKRNVNAWASEDLSSSNEKRRKSESYEEHAKISAVESICHECATSGTSATGDTETITSADVTSQAELEKLIRAIASNPELSPVQKNTTIQGLRDSVWKSNLKQKMLAGSDVGSVIAPELPQVPQPVGHYYEGPTSIPSMGTHGARLSAAKATRSRRVTPPSFYYKKNREGKVELVWSSDSPNSTFPPKGESVPLFSASELAPTYHDGATGAVLGCPHYARACKLRHPSSGRLYTCRLCCEQEREMPMKDQDSPLDRYAVTEILCMRCGALQPAGGHCVNATCESRSKPFSKYTCRLCNLYDDGPSKNIYHCPFCNTCRQGLGLGIDYRHCMRCNACVSLAEDKHHCIPQRLQGTCPICHESMFESTEPLRGLQCGHAMHLSCFSMYMRGHSYTCPLCKKSVEDMNDYFSLLDSAVRMQPMPAAYSSTISNIYCQDCGNTGEVQYHFVGCKCAHCGSYNTRELGRVQGAAGAP